MEYRIDREALDDSAVRSSLSKPSRFRSCWPTVGRHESASQDEVRALWLSSGLATHVGLAIYEEPERFITATPSPATPAAALAA